MTADATRSLSPLDPQVVAHLTATLGSPQPHTFARDGVRDLAVLGAWIVGVGRTSDDGAAAQRGVDVEILLTVGGYLVTTRKSWTRTADGGSHDSQTSQVHETPAGAYQWLITDGKGKLGPASKQAWVWACRKVPPMADLEFEQVS